MKTARWLRLIVLSVPLVLAGCTGGRTEKQKGAADKQYEVKGKVVAVAPDKSSVTLDHEAIPELNMMAMKMDYPVESPKVLEGIQAGDQVHGHLKAQGKKYIVSHLGKR